MDTYVIISYIVLVGIVISAIVWYNLNPKKIKLQPPIYIKQPYTYYHRVSSLEEIPESQYLTGNLVAIEQETGGDKLYIHNGETFVEITHTVCPTCGK